MPTKPPIPEENLLALEAEITEVFSPGAPVRERDLFSGRLAQLATLIDAVRQRGRHAVIFGERGVGKTSLANILNLVLHTPTKEIINVRVNADPSDSYTSLWKKIFRRLDHVLEDGSTKSLADSYSGEITIDDVQLELAAFGDHQVSLIVIDEFDRIKDRHLTDLLADTIKSLSDYSVGSTIVLVGVAEDIGQLIEGHHSIARSLIQVKMPRMSQDELAQIIATRYMKCGMKADEEALWKMTFLSRGLPFYAQLLGMYAARMAISEKTLIIIPEHVNKAFPRAIKELEQSIKEDYFYAIRSQRSSDTLYIPVLLACALAKCDEMGEFQQSSVTEPLNRILPGKNYKPTTFAFHMNEFCKQERKSVLTASGRKGNLRYRFTDPRMQPFVILKGLADGLINDATAEVYANRRQLSLSTDW